MGRNLSEKEKEIIKGFIKKTSKEICQFLKIEYNSEIEILIRQFKYDVSFLLNFPEIKGPSDNT